jgi:hypothetical protein
MESPAIRRAIDTPVAVMSHIHPIFIKYKEDAAASAMRDWIFSNEDAFLQHFAVPHVCFWLNSIKNMDNYKNIRVPITVPADWPRTPGNPGTDLDIAAFGVPPYSDVMKFFLKFLPFRIRTLEVTRVEAVEGTEGMVGSPLRYNYTAVHFSDPSFYLPGFTYCEYDVTNNRPMYLSEEMYLTMIRSTLSTSELLDPEETRIISIDLYLDRNQSFEAIQFANGKASLYLGWHSDSDRSFADRDDKTRRQVLQAESVDYVKLLTIMRPNDFSKTVTIMANYSTNEEIHDLVTEATSTMDNHSSEASAEASRNNAAEKLRVMDKVRNTMTFVSENGTSCILNDRLLYHTSPWGGGLPTVDINASLGLRQPDGAFETAMMYKPEIEKRMSTLDKRVIEDPTPRCLFRVHYSRKGATRAEYIHYGESRDFPFRKKAVPIPGPLIQIDVGIKPDGEVNLSELNSVLGKHGPLADIGFGGTKKKRSKNKKTRRGGNPDEILRINFDTDDYYKYFEKYKNGLALIDINLNK